MKIFISLTEEMAHTLQYIGNDNKFNYFVDRGEYFRTRNYKDSYIKEHIIDKNGKFIDFDARKVVDKWCRVKFREDVLDIHFLANYGRKMNLLIHCNIPLK